MVPQFCIRCVIRCSIKKEKFVHGMKAMLPSFSVCARLQLTISWFIILLFICLFLKIIISAVILIGEESVYLVGGC